MLGLKVFIVVVAGVAVEGTEALEVCVAVVSISVSTSNNIIKYTEIYRCMHMSLIWHSLTNVSIDV